MLQIIYEHVVRCLLVLRSDKKVLNRSEIPGPLRSFKVIFLAQLSKKNINNNKFQLRQF
jgi:hypothetical protein